MLHILNQRKKFKREFKSSEICVIEDVDSNDFGTRHRKRVSSALLLNPKVL